MKNIAIYALLTPANGHFCSKNEQKNAFEAIAA
jgi:hypothetical protein